MQQIRLLLKIPSRVEWSEVERAEYLRGDFAVGQGEILAGRMFGWRGGSDVQYNAQLQPQYLISRYFRRYT